MGQDKFTHIEKPNQIELEVRAQRRKLIADMEVSGLSEIDALDDIVDFAKAMKAKYPTLHDHVRAYHVLIGSSVPHGDSNLQDDFPEPDSVHVFLAGLRKKYFPQEI